MLLSELSIMMEEFFENKLLPEDDPNICFFLKDKEDSDLVRIIDLSELELSSEILVSMKRGDLAVPDVNTEVSVIFSTKS